MNRYLITAFLLFTLTPLFSQSDYTDIELISLFDKTINSSLQRLQRMGKLGKEEINGNIAGKLYYSTEIVGFNEVVNILEYIGFCDEQIILTGSQISHVNWGGTGKIHAEFSLTGIEDFELIMDFDLKRRIPVSGTYLISRNGEQPCEYPYDILGD